MPPAPSTLNEAGRLAELERYAILRSPPEAVFDRITHLAARLFHCPIAVLNFVANDRQWFKSCIGLDFTESSRDVSLCAWAILSDDVMVIPDARQDPRFADNCFVIADGGIRFYAGAPLVTSRGYNLGTLCVIDNVPRPQGLTVEEISTLKDLAAMVISQLDGRLIAQEAEEVRDVLQTTLSSIGDGVIASDAQGLVTFLNPVAQELTGWTEEEARGRRIEEIFVILNEATRRVVENPVLRAIAEGRVIGLENHTILITKTGREIPIDDSGAPIRRGDNVVGGVLIFRDISQRRKAERLLEYSEVQFRSTFAGAPLGMVITLLDGHFIESNQAYRDITGYSEAQLPAVNFISLTHPDEIENNYKLFRSLLAGEVDSYVLEKRIISNSGAIRWVRAHGSLLKDADGNPARVIGLVEDISARKQAEEKLQLVHAQLEASAAELRRSNDDLSQFAHVASHDLRSPLNTLLQFSQLLERTHSEQLGQEGRQYLTFLKNSGKRMAALIEDLLEYAKVSSEKDEEGAPVDINVVVATAIENLQAAVGESGAVITSDELPTVPGNGTRFEQVFQNLIGNAIHYRGDRAPEIHISAVDHGRHWCFSCKDNGIGIAPEYQKTIFEPFKRLHGADRPGSGIGLAVCQKIIDRYQGRIWVESMPEQGSIFFFTLPKANAQETPS